ncbi:ROK family protein [Fictibacillus phosphorivorans]|uniref:ROK family protein n=1 Tax=Fictibacillus phosphorivorans TaxID=1221500 RepID=UPI0020425084|nr:ROK family protein [Fictibacillus phosphorivorans]MCM3717785.1 ROK family protein [Fictibacillus phosphorivorans]MCM3777013.1 ROK family protein [Fictibacillus phosphorivorans]
MKVLAGFDIGGTKCAVSVGVWSNEAIKILRKTQFPTPSKPEEVLEQMIHSLEKLIGSLEMESVDAIGISCGGPLDSEKGVVLSPPNLHNWDRIDVITPIKNRFSVPVLLQNDANACALAEWKWGAGKGCKNMIFLTFGTGMGAGLILNSNLYTGTNDNAGEVGHIRLEHDGPVGYGKRGSFEGFCSGGGIALMAQSKAEEWIQEGKSTEICSSLDCLSAITTKIVGEAAQRGDPLAVDIFKNVGRQLGRGLAMLVDLLNPERIVIGSIYGRQQSLLEPMVIETLKKEALPQSLAVCDIVTAGLGEQVGDYASLSVALYELENLPTKV